jgi:adenylate cyclase
MHVFSGAMSRVADPMRRLFAQTYLAPGISEDELGLRFGDMADELLPIVSADLEFLLRMHLRDFARHDALTAAERTTGSLPEAVEVAVAFADIVGFTALGEDVAEEALTDIAEELERLASAHVKPPARVVKAIGDAVMVVGRDVRVVVESMLDLVAAAEAQDGMPPVRAGIAFGRAVPRLGDWFGPTVNLAARLSARARPDSVLVSNPVRDALGDAASSYAFSEAGHKRLKGISDPVPTLRVRREAPR